MAYRPANEAWSKVSDTGISCK